MKYFFFYKMTVDDGGAPCVKNGLLSLAICKPMLRKSAEAGDVVVGFAASSLCKDNRLIYVAEITQKLENGYYYRKKEYFKRSDCIYKYSNGEYMFRKTRKYHFSEEDLKHDLGKHPTYDRDIVLLSERFCYWGNAGTTDYKKYQKLGDAVARLNRGHRVNHSADLDRVLKSFVDSCHLDTSEQKGKPLQNPQKGKCHRHDRCISVPSC